MTSRPNNPGVRLLDIQRRLHELPELFHPLYKKWSDTWIAHNFSRIFRKSKTTEATKKSGNLLTEQNQGTGQRTESGGKGQQPDGKPAAQPQDTNPCTDMGGKIKPQKKGIISRLEKKQP
jgi:hypothetical protein